jgi:NADPH2:quinone reductase
VDIYRRKGLYQGQLPFTPGSEAAGVVDAVGEGVTELAVGDRVASAEIPGAYAEYAVAPARVLVPLQDGVDFRVGAALLLQGITAHYLALSTYPLKQGDVALVHAAAGGVGQLLVQIAKRRGARVIGTVSTEEKAELARAAGADEVILYTREDFAAAARRLTDGRGVHVVYDSVGRDTFARSLDALCPRGYLVLFGQSSGPVAPIDPQILNSKGSLFLTRPTMTHYLADRQELLWRTDDLFGWVGTGELRVRIDTTFSLANAVEAHRYMEDRRSKGKVLLIP